MVGDKYMAMSTPTGPHDNQESLLIVDNVTKRFGGVVAVDGCSLGIRRGTITGLIGPNGVGKPPCLTSLPGSIRRMPAHMVRGGAHRWAPAPRHFCAQDCPHVSAGPGAQAHDGAGESPSRAGAAAGRKLLECLVASTPGLRPRTSLARAR